MKREHAHRARVAQLLPEHRCRVLIRLTPLPGITQDDAAPMRIGTPPFLDLLQGSKASETSILIIEAAVSCTRGSSGAVGVAHCGRARLRWPVKDLITPMEGNPGNGSNGRADARL